MQCDFMLFFVCVHCYVCYSIFHNGRLLSIVCGSVAARGTVTLSKLLAILLIFGLSSIAVQANPITFSFTGTGSGSGSLGITAFNDSAFEVLISADTDDVEEFEWSPDTLIIYGLGGTIDISGVGIGIFTEPLYVFNNQQFEAVGFGDEYEEWYRDLIDLVVPGVGLNTYDLTTSFGPAFTENPLFGQFDSVALDIGNLTFTDMWDTTFTATMVPVPSDVLLGMLDLSVAGIKLRKYAKKLVE